MITKLNNTEDQKKALAQYLHEVDKDFGIPLSNKTDLDTYVIKLLENGVVLVFSKNGNINGIITGYCNDIENGNAIISLLSVRKQYRGLGISRQLVNAMIDTCRQAEMKRIHVDSINPVAVALYKSSGFQVNRVEMNNGIHKTYLEFQLN